MTPARIDQELRRLMWWHACPRVATPHRCVLFEYRSVFSTQTENQGCHSTQPMTPSKPCRQCHPVACTKPCHVVNLSLARREHHSQPSPCGERASQFAVLAVLLCCPNPPSWRPPRHLAVACVETVSLVRSSTQVQDALDRDPQSDVQAHWYKYTETKRVPADCEAILEKYPLLSASKKSWRTQTLRQASRGNDRPVSKNTKVEPFATLRSPQNKPGLEHGCTARNLSNAPPSRHNPAKSRSYLRPPHLSSMTCTESPTPISPLCQAASASFFVANVRTCRLLLCVVA